MNSNNKNNYNFCSIDIIKFCLANWKPLLIVSLTAIVISVIISAPFITTPKYKSTVVMFPAVSTSISKTLLSSSGVIKENIMQFGEDEDTERLLQVLNSDKLRKKVIDKFNLSKHYEIDSTAKYPKTTLMSQFEKNFDFQRTKYMALKVEVLDKDPELAAKMANFIALQVDSIMNSIYKERARQAFDIVTQEYIEMKKQVNRIKDSLRKISQYGITDYESQAEVFNAAMAKAIAENNKQAIRSLNKKINILEEYGPSYLFLKDHLEYETERLSETRARYAEARVDAERNIPYKYIVDNAHVAEKKAFPIRWLIVAVSTLSAFILCLIVLFIINKITE